MIRLTGIVQPSSASIEELTAQELVAQLLVLRFGVQQCRYWQKLANGVRLLN